MVSDLRWPPSILNLQLFLYNRDHPRNAFPPGLAPAAVTIQDRALRPCDRRYAGLSGHKSGFGPKMPSFF